MFTTPTIGEGKNDSYVDLGNLVTKKTKNKATPKSSLEILNYFIGINIV